ncbi:flagellar biosynthesis protein FlhA [Paracoccus sp. 1_MG-2023]|uniref:flagellar biosynthesis protein FlhA n=1 Tax=unclassified Paracoccus (in: a-proteobacteria) TaxID=2688777 RepID=UPI001C0A514F|nr:MULTISPECIES: flagellar biosynthesis protein FlhA [unclassified Paracoccus (in: a-proteobacteria)]MBU2956826.1 flagellar biosynthesis protein FlhA [Paracoccus sp. C2R09]MDO6670211.1 flagellar biosynthesis protein FlhA [Paracoccus sp. 1_MG-2023]
MSAAAAPGRKPGRLLDAPLLVTGGLVLVVISLVIPLPASVLDLGIAISIATATLVLVMASLVQKPTDFQAFPVLLLVSLVIRLSLNVSSTRLILTEGQNGGQAAGQVINGFADFVAGGSVLVGITVFAVISVVNFMVITKGSGRMAEVAARFALDSLPGKQLAIDGDLNAGAIDHQEAKRRRVQEQREISFFGSLDGASKFVKGDAVAGFVITMINLAIGLAVGVTVHGMPIAEAASTYSHLTIGDGLVSQIPALITSMAAALLLSRGGATDTTADLLSAEFTRSWQPAAMVAGAMIVISFIPGMPRLLFLAIAASLLTLSWRIATRPQAEEPVAPAQDAAARPAARIGDVIDTDEISVEIGSDLIVVALDQARGLGSRIQNLRIHIARSFGLILPDVRITDTDDLSPGDYQIRIQGVVRGRGTLRPHEILALGPEAVLADLRGTSVREPVYASPARWIQSADQDEASVMGATVVTPMEVLSTHLMEVVKAHLPALLTLGAMQRQIEELKTLSDTARAERYRKYFDGMIPDKVTPETLLAILRALLEERISIRNLPLIVDAISEFRGIEQIETVYELVRKRLRGQITQHYSDDAGRIAVLQLHPAWEAEFVRADTETGRPGGGAMTPAMSKKLVDATRKALSQAEPVPRTVLLAPDHRRRMVRAVLAANGMAIPVLGLEEVDPAIETRILGTVEAA